MVVATLAFPAIVFVTFVIGLFMMQERIIFPAPAGPRPMGTGNAELVRIETADGERLSALWHAPEPGEPTIVFLHGNATAIGNLVPLIDTVAQAGFGFIVPAWRGYPGSTGSPSERGLMLDAEAAFDFASERTRGPVAVMGQSLGSGPAVHLSIARTVSGVVLVSPYDSVRAVASARFRFVPVGALLRHPFRSDERIGDVSAPLLIVHGTGDTVIPVAHGRRLHAAAPEGARYVEIDGATHFDILGRTLDLTLAFVRSVSSVSNARPTG